MWSAKSVNKQCFRCLPFHILHFARIFAQYSIKFIDFLSNCLCKTIVCMYMYSTLSTLYYQYLSHILHNRMLRYFVISICSPNLVKVLNMECAYKWNRTHFPCKLHNIIQACNNETLTTLWNADFHQIQIQQVNSIHPMVIHFKDRSWYLVFCLHFADIFCRLDFDYNGISYDVRGL